MPVPSSLKRSDPTPSATAPVRSTPPSAEGRSDIFSQLPQLIERLHRRYLDLLRAELAHLEVRDLAPVQLLLLLNLETEDLSVQELVDRGNYLRTQAVYNIKKMVENGYLEQSRGMVDRRTVRVRPTRKSQQLCEQVRARLGALGDAFARTEDRPENIDLTYRVLRRLERAWDDYLRYGRA